MNADEINKLFDNQQIMFANSNRIFKEEIINGF
jgi:hypothetical protein